MMRSPNEMIVAGQEMLLGGKEPVTWHEQVTLMSFLAVNIHSEVAESACQLMKAIYPDHFNLLTETVIHQIVEQQTVVTS